MHASAKREPVERQRRALPWKDVIRTFREVAQNRPIITMVLLGGSASLLIGNAVQTQMPAFATDLGAGAAGFGYSALLMAGAAGAGQRAARPVRAGLGRVGRGARPVTHLLHFARVEAA